MLARSRNFTRPQPEDTGGPGIRKLSVAERRSMAPAARRQGGDGRQNRSSMLVYCRSKKN
jgi:hypothetical protein